MTVEELRKEAEKLGYSIVKKTHIPKLLPCVCGCNRREHWYVSNINTRVLKCKRCGKSIAGKNDIEARKMWNEMIRMENNGNKRK